ncbi:MAG TPA: M23 family metallopeptidase [Bryobacteraceae bacterium]|jgi:murein DD-endopeptidase MepM/ murein hydrolase activator NlpD
MALKVANYNALRRETDSLRVRYQALLKNVNETDSQLASLQLYAKEVSLAYGIKEKLEGPSDISARDKLVPTFAESVEEYNFLRRIDALALQNKVSHRLKNTISKPTVWPLDGRLLSPFGKRTDPFSEEGAFHKGVDISATFGTAVHTTADGIVIFSQFQGGYGLLVVVDHGGGFMTYYAHLSRTHVRVGQEVRRGDAVGMVGATGRVTAPHLHYEVRVQGTPQNPIHFMQSKTGASQVAEVAKQYSPF